MVCYDPYDTLEDLLRTSKRQDLPAVRNLAVVYTLAGADCIDVAAEEAVIEAARFGIF